MKPYYLLDTNIISELSKQSPNKKVLTKINTYKNLCAISAISYQEMLTGFQLLPEGKKKTFIEDFIYNFVVNEFQILEYSSLCAHVYADIYTTCSRLGFSRPYSDTQIAATAKSNAMILVTRNTKDFQVFADHCYLPIENWFEE